MLNLEYMVRLMHVVGYCGAVFMSRASARRVRTQPSAHAGSEDRTARHAALSKYPQNTDRPQTNLNQELDN